MRAEYETTDKLELQKGQDGPTHGSHKKYKLFECHTEAISHSWPKLISVFLSPKAPDHAPVDSNK